jgi:hypothetical protein
MKRLWRNKDKAIYIQILQSLDELEFGSLKNMNVYHEHWNLLIKKKHGEQFEWKHYVKAFKFNTFFDFFKAVKKEE